MNQGVVYQHTKSDLHMEPLLPLYHPTIRIIKAFIKGNDKLLAVGILSESFIGFSQGTFSIGFNSTVHCRIKGLSNHLLFGLHWITKGRW